MSLTVTSFFSTLIPYLDTIHSMNFPISSRLVHSRFNTRKDARTHEKTRRQSLCLSFFRSNLSFCS